MGHQNNSPSPRIFVAFCSEMPFICSSMRLGVYATDSTVLKPPSTTSWISRLVKPAIPFERCQFKHLRAHHGGLLTSSAMRGVGAPGPVMLSSPTCASSYSSAIFNSEIHSEQCDRVWEIGTSFCKAIQRELMVPYGGDAVLLGCCGRDATRPAAKAPTHEVM